MIDGSEVSPMRIWKLALFWLAALASLEAQPVAYTYDHTELIYTVGSPSLQVDCAVGQNPLRIVLPRAQGPAVTQTLARLVKDNCLNNIFQNTLSGLFTITAPASLTLDRT